MLLKDIVGLLPMMEKVSFELVHLQKDALFYDGEKNKKNNVL